jgi:hypothetical protein
MAAGTNMLEVARAYEELAEIAEELAQAVVGGTGRAALAPRAQVGRLGLTGAWRVRLGAGIELLAPSQIDG